MIVPPDMLWKLPALHALVHPAITPPDIVTTAVPGTEVPALSPQQYLVVETAAAHDTAFAIIPQAILQLLAALAVNDVKSMIGCVVDVLLERICTLRLAG